MRKEHLLDEVRKEFPLENSLQELHLVRLQIREETKGFSSEEYLRYINDMAEQARNEP